MKLLKISGEGDNNDSVYSRNGNDSDDYVENNKEKLRDLQKYFFNVCLSQK